MSKINKNKGIVFWVTGMPGSGKTSISKKIKDFIEKIWSNSINKWR